MTIFCTIVTEAVDPNEDELTYSYEWKVDGADAGIASDTVTASNTSSWEEWTCSVVASDGELNGVSTSASVQVVGECSFFGVRRK